jgi:predicted ATPase/DNA-binding winged helix-turn-helix (wHTH) protein/Tfp pilus assembly protein PilF
VEPTRIQLELGLVDFARRVLRAPDGERSLTTKEAELLSYLAQRPERDVPRDELLREVWGYRGAVQSRTADTTLQRLRSKVESDPANPRHLLTVHGVGYRFVPLSDTMRMPVVAPPPEDGPRSAGGTNLGPDRGSFVGREDERQDLRRRLRGPGPILTLRGAGGTGKTRLARQVAREVSGEFPGGVWFCDLTECRDTASVLSVLGRVLGVPLGEIRGLDDPIARLGHALRSRGRTLVVLDNCEQVVDEGAPLLTGWVEKTPAVRFLLTSREALRVANEVVFDLDPLPDDAALELFVARARDARPGFSPDGATRQTIATLVQALEGLPLAIELAAARVAVLPPQAILDRMGDRFRLLSSSRRDLPPRQRTLRGALDWSWDLLDEPERRVLAQCSVFRGGFMFDAVEAVVDAGPDAPWTADLVQALLDKSLLRSDEPEELPGTTRMRMLESVRHWAAEKLDAFGDGGAVEARHTAFYAQHGQALAAQVDGPDGVDVVRRLALESYNLDAVWKRERSRDPQLACRVAMALHEVLRVRGPADQHHALLDEALRLVAPEDDDLRLSLHIARARARRQVGRVDEARADADAAMTLAERRGPAAKGEALLARGLVEEAAGDLEGCCESYRLAMRRFQDAGSVFGVVRAQAMLAFDLWQRGHRDEAEPILRRALKTVEAQGLQQQAAKLLSTLGLILGEQGLWEEALDQMERSRTSHAARGDRRGEGIVLANMGSLHSSQGRLSEALAVYREALRAQRSVGDVRLEGIILRNIGVVLLGMGREREAEQTLEEALDRHRDASDRFSEGRVLSDLAEIRLLKGEVARADALYEQALAVATEAGDERYALFVRGNRALRDYTLGHLDQAEAALAPVLEDLPRLAGPRPHGYYLAFAGALAADRGARRQSMERLGQARDQLQLSGDPAGLGALAICELIAERALGSFSGDEEAEAHRRLEEAGAPRHAHAIEHAMLLLRGGLPS